MALSWVKWRTTHSHGPAKWQWEEVDVEDMLQGDTADDQLTCFCRDKAHAIEHEFSRGFGVEAEFEDPPMDVLLAKIRANQGDVVLLQAQISRWVDQLVKKEG